MKKLILTIENKKGHFWGRIEDKGNFMPTGQGETIEAMIQNVRFYRRLSGA
jgi:predicted RNase H-like HicB family nuclease